jgi:glycosyltransferase involved in cell wall biosynthesis
LADQDSLNILLLAAAGSAHTRRWADALTGLGHQVAVASWQPGPTIPGTAVRVAPAVGAGSARRLLLAVPWLRRAVREIRPDVVHVHSLGTYAALSLALPVGPARVLSPYGGDLRAARRSPGRAAMLRLALHRADMVLPCSAELGAEVAGRYAVSAERMRVLSWGVAEHLIASQPTISPSSVRAGLGIPSNATVVLSVRSTSATYRTLEIVSAFADAAHDRPDLYLVVLSGGRLDRHRARQAQEAYLDQVRAVTRPFAERVLIVEHTLSQQQTFEMMCASDVAVSVPPEDQHSYSVLEAALAGCRLFLSDIPPYREMISSGLAANLLVEPLVDDLAQRLREVLPDDLARRGNREYIVTHEHGGAKLAIHEQIFRQLSRHS